MNDAPFPSNASTATPSPEPRSNFFDWIRGTGISRTDDAWLGGVAGGIARHTGVDPLIIRGVILVVAVLGGPALFLYAVAWALLPDSSGRIHTERALQGIFDPAVIAITVLIALTFVPFMRGIWWQGAPAFWNMPEWLESTLRTGWVLVLVASLVWLTIVIARRTPQSATEAPPARSHADFWTSPATPPAGASFASATDAPANATTPGPSAPDSGAAPSAGTSSAWFPTPESAHSGSPDPRVYGAVWNPGPTAEQREAQRRERDAIRAQNRREHEERYRRRQPGAAFVSIALGLAVLGGVFTTIALGYATVSDTSVLIGVGVALGVIALATVIAGIRGKESGALGFFSIVAILVLLFVGVFPRGTSVSVVGNTIWEVTEAAPRSSAGYSMAAGSPTLDLSALDDRGAEVGGVVELWLGAGTVTVDLPEDVPVILQVAGGVAGLSYVDDGELRERGAPLYREVVRFGDTSSDDTTTVRIWLGAGSVDLVNSERNAR
ncbi:phage shock protein PspC (stress-responsive transcriptional regulator) [Okibacterium sp. HSC-33S16]|uniref:PspC domain-containing protein n=1 Tax=Okibacterium sp. HSC-33S16 TaxID=2910965 RepID=UPI0020A19FFC|nr:PspC domain-containing protein [Okibacterium sp. HSC-33S16]MCP2031336.1 phage shock protein PspC (stress-responsive transcriptional regulator) [Okibacterium sp. HSC-33S16]